MQDKLKWAMAGRSLSKLEALKSKLVDKVSAASKASILVADAGDKAALQKLAARCKVLINTVGPFYLYGDAIVEACVKEGT